jgi:hypothetical protein
MNIFYGVILTMSMLTGLISASSLSLPKKFYLTLTTSKSYSKVLFGNELDLFGSLSKCEAGPSFLLSKN